MTFKDYKKIAEEVEACKNDSELLDILQKYPKVLEVKVDEDRSCVSFQDIEDEVLFDKICEELELFVDFKNHHKQSDLVLTLFKKLGIKTELW